MKSGNRHLRANKNACARQAALLRMGGEARNMVSVVTRLLLTVHVGNQLAWSLQQNPLQQLFVADAVMLRHAIKSQFGIQTKNHVESLV